MKEDYKELFDLTFSLLRPGGLFLAYNAISNARYIQDFLNAIKTYP